MINSVTNEFVAYLLWEISNTDSNRIFISSYSNLHPHTTCSESKCLPFGDYSLVTRCSKNETMSENVSYSFQAANIIIYDMSTNENFESEESFTVCASDIDCLDYDGCTTDICDPETRICENQVMNNTDCSNCTWLSLVLTMDNYPDETSWNLASTVGKREVSVLSGM